MLSHPRLIHFRLAPPQRWNRQGLSDSGVVDFPAAEPAPAFISILWTDMEERTDTIHIKSDRCTSLGLGLADITQERFVQLNQVGELVNRDRRKRQAWLTGVNSSEFEDRLGGAI